MSQQQGHYTITFGENAENHVRMQQLGHIGEHGFTLDDLMRAKQRFEERGVSCQLVHLNDALSNVSPRVEAEDAHVLIARNGAGVLVRELGKNEDDLYNEQRGIEYDKMAFMYGRVVNKRMRENVCFGSEDQEPDYPNKKGRIVSFEHVPLIAHIQHTLPEIIGDVGRDLYGEGNYYPDIKKCGIGFHGDGERKKVIAVKLGSNLPLHYQWYHQSKPIGERVRLSLGRGDIYVMSEKASGFDWKLKKKPTLRHAAGAPCNEKK